MKKQQTGSSGEFIRVTKSFTFEMAHALYNYDGPCRNIHGHSYTLSVTILGRTLQSSGHAKDGLVIDFSDIKALVKKEILDDFDHALVLNKKSTRKSIPKSSGKVIYADYQPSCENLLLEFRNRLIRVFPDNYILYALKLHETNTSCAEWYLTDQL